MNNNMLIFSFCFLLAACSSTPNQVSPSSNAESTDTRLTAIEQELTQWKEMKPSLARLVLIEKELKALIAEVAQVAAAQKSASQPALISPLPQPIKTPESLSPINAITKSFSPYALQVFTVDNSSDIEKKWLFWSNKYQHIILEYPAIYEVHQKESKSYYRVKITNFSTKDLALDTCKQIKEQGGDCFLTNDKGTPIY